VRFKDLNRLFVTFLLLVWLSSLAGCVTETNNPLTRKADPAEAVKKYVQLGLAYIQQQDYDLARTHLNRALQIAPDDAPANAAMGLIYQHYSETRVAENYFNKALSSDPHYTQGRTYLGAFYYSLGRFKEALDQFTRASEDVTYESRAQIFSNIGLCQIRLNNLPAARAAYEKTLLLDRYNAPALSGLTALWIQDGNYRQAQYYYNRLVDMIRANNLKHTPKSLWMGIQIARHFKQVEQEKSLAMILGESYPKSEEYLRYKALTGHE
jgi:type IV pilus assembly protein PilF